MGIGPKTGGGAQAWGRGFLRKRVEKVKEYMCREIGKVQVGVCVKMEKRGEKNHKKLYIKRAERNYFFYINLKHKTKEKTCTFSF